MTKFGVFEGYGGPAQLRRYSSAACHIDVVLPHSGCCRVDDLLGICLAAVQLRRLPASSLSAVPGMLVAKASPATRQLVQVCDGQQTS